MAKITMTTVYLEINDEEVECTATCYIPKYRPATYLDPEEGGYPEDTEVVRNDTKEDVTSLLTDGQLERVEQELLDQSESDYEEYEQSKADAYEDR